MAFKSMHCVVQMFDVLSGLKQPLAAAVVAKLLTVNSALD